MTSWPYGRHAPQVGRIYRRALANQKHIIHRCEVNNLCEIEQSSHAEQKASGHRCRRHQSLPPRGMAGTASEWWRSPPGHVVSVHCIIVAVACAAREVEDRGRVNDGTLTDAG